MFLKKQAVRIALILLLLTGLVSFIEATYYEPEFFPIGLSGIMHTGYGPENCPYNSYDDPTTWTWSDERQLITALGVNCLGCADIKPSYLIDLKPLNPGTNNYLHQVCRGIDKETQRGIILA